MRRVLGFIARVVGAAALVSFAAGACSGFENGPFAPLPTGAGGGGGAGGEGGSAAGCVSDGQCEVKTETCACSDCADTAFCVSDQCVDDGLCTYDDACICDDCLVDEGCKPASCEDDGACDSFFEGCACADCAMKLECLDNPPGSGGAGSGGQGGGAGSGGQGGS